MTLLQLKDNIKTECAGTGAGVSVSDFEIVNMLNDNYLEWCIKSKCIKKSITTDWQEGPYLDIRDIPDIINPFKPLTFFNTVSNLYLSDEASRETFDRLRLDSENCIGTPLFWDLIDPYRVMFFPNYGSNPVGTFTMEYYSYPDLLADDGDIPVFANDVHLSLTKGTVFRYLESLEEFSKASTWDKDFQIDLAKFSKRVQGFGRIGPSYGL